MNRSLSKATIASIAVHCLLFLALMNIDYEVPRAGSLPVVNLSLRPLPGFPSQDESREEGSEGGETPAPERQEPDSAETLAEAEAVPAPEPAPIEEPAPPVEPAEPRIEDAPSVAQEEALIEPVEPTEPAAPAEPETVEAIAEAEPVESDVANEPAEPAETVAVEVTVPDVSPAEEPPASEAEALTTDAPAERSVASEPTPPPAPASAPIDEDQQRMLTRRLRRMVARLEDLDESDMAWKHDGREYQARLTSVAAEGEMDLDYVIVDVTAIGADERMSAQLRMKRLAFSNFAQFVDEWDPKVQIHDDVIDGRFHSNSEIFVGNTGGVQPTFLGRVTTAYRGVNTSNSPGRVRRDEVFLGGLETGVRKISLPRRYLPFPDSGDVEDGQVLEFEEDTRIVFLDDGSFLAQGLESESPLVPGFLTEDTTYLVAAPKAALHVKGTVNGRVLVYSPQRIVIEGDLVYADNPRIDEQSDDFLGLVSDRTIEVAHPEVTGLGDLEINASIYAKRRFSVTRFRTRDDATLTIYGSLSAGSISATEPRFATNIQFDTRLENLRPPSFPMTDRYEVEDWDSVWLIDELLESP